MTWSLFFGMCIKLNKTLVGHSYKFNTTNAPAHLTDRCMFFCLGYSPEIPFCSIQSTFSWQRSQNIGAQAPFKYQLNLFAPKEMCESCGFCHGDPTISFQIFTVCFSIILCHVGINIGHHIHITLISRIQKSEG